MWTLVPNLINKTKASNCWRKKPKTKEHKIGTTGENNNKTLQVSTKPNTSATSKSVQSYTDKATKYTLYKQPTQQNGMRRSCRRTKGFKAIHREAITQPVSIRREILQLYSSSKAG